MLSVEDFEQQKRAMSKQLLDAMKHLQAGQLGALTNTCTTALVIAVWLRFAQASESETAAMSKLISEINTLDFLPKGQDAFKGAQVGHKPPARELIGRSAMRLTPHRIGNENFAQKTCRAGMEDHCAFSQRQVDCWVCMRGTDKGDVIQGVIDTGRAKNKDVYCSGPPHFREVV